MNKDDLLIEKAEAKEKNSKKQKIDNIERIELLSGIRTMIKSSEKDKKNKG